MSKTTKVQIVVAIAFVLLTSWVVSLLPIARTFAQASTQQGPARWEKDIAAFEARDKTNPPPQNALLFIGSSTILLWKTLAEDLPHHQVINRGFGGSQIADATYYADRIVIPYKPKMVLLRSGGNDIYSGKLPEQVFADFQAFVAKVHAKLPKTDIVYISLSPSVARWNQWDKEVALNKMVKDFTRKNKRVQYLDTADISVGADGKPRPELFIADKLHLNAEGYKLLAARVRKYLSK
jgi:lysophospholipase L1-like esterase